MPFQSGKTLSELISDVCGWSQKMQETEDTFTEDLQVLARKIIVCKPSFHLEANQQLKAQYVHKLQDPYYAAMACSTLQSSPEEETFTRLPGMPSYNVWYAHKAEQIICPIFGH